ncbi:MAG: DUF6412 domain-containing protein [Pseudonocardiaceae bacterium]
MLTLVVVMLAALAALAANTPGDVAVLGTAIAALLISAWALRLGRDRVALAAIANADGPTGDERCLRGSFRRQSNPDTPGRPRRPRAPDTGHWPV